VTNKDHIYKYWEERVKQNGRYENIYTIGKRGKDDEAGTEVTVNVLEEVFHDQRKILAKWVDRDVTKVPQVLISYTEVLDLYNKGLKVPDDVIICWPDDNFGNIRQLPDEKEQKRPGGSGVYYHFQWLNGATTAYPWLFTTPPALTWLEMKKAYDCNARKLWIVNVGDIKPAELGIDHFMQMAWDMSRFENNEPEKFLTDWASGIFGIEFAYETAQILKKHFELGYARRPEHMVMFDGRKNELKWNWFTHSEYNDEVQKRMDEYSDLIRRVDETYGSLPVQLKDAFFQMVVYNVKGAALHNLKVLYAQKSHAYGREKRASAATYASNAQYSENRIAGLIRHYNRELVTVGSKWDRMASLPGPWGGQWHQWDMPPLSTFSGEGEPELHLTPEGDKKDMLPGFSVYDPGKHFIDLYNTGNGVVYWEAETSDSWIKLSETLGVISDEKRIWVTVNAEQAPNGSNVQGKVVIRWNASTDEEWRSWENLSETDRENYKKGTLSYSGPDVNQEVGITLFNPEEASVGNVEGYVESNGCISLEAEHFSRKNDTSPARWSVMEGLGRTGNSMVAMPFNMPGFRTTDEILSGSPSLEYDLWIFTTGEAVLRLNCIPSFPVNKDHGLRVACSLGDEKPLIVDSKGEKDVISNLLTVKTKLNFTSVGPHTLKIWMVDPGLVIDKIIIDTGGVKDSYLGPPESVYYKN
jgi:hypothetical protein